MRKAAGFAAAVLASASTSNASAQSAEAVHASAPAGSARSASPRDLGSATISAGERAPADGSSAVRPVLPGEYGSWLYGSANADPASLAGGELAVSQQLSLVLEGAHNSFDPRLSGMRSGLRLHLMPPQSSFQMSLAGGGLTDLGGSSGAWTEVDASQAFARFQIAGSLRMTRFVGDFADQQSLTGRAGASYDFHWARVGVDYAFERGLASRAAILPWMAVPVGQRSVFRATGAVPVAGDNVFPVRFSYIGNF